MTQLVCNRAAECGQRCAHSEPHKRLWGKGIISQRVDLCASRDCLWWPHKDGFWHQTAQCEEVAGDGDATKAD